MNFKNIVFFILTLGTFSYFFVHDGIIRNFLNNDTSYISWTLVILYPIIALNYMILDTDKNSVLFKWSNMYEELIFYFGLLGMMIGLYISIKGLNSVEISYTNIQKVLQKVTGGFYIDMVSMITVISIYILIRVQKFLKEISMPIKKKQVFLTESDYGDEG